MKPKISQALEYLLDKLKRKEDAHKFSAQKPLKRLVKSLVFCRNVNQPAFDTHYLSQCIFFPVADYRCFTKNNKFKFLTTNTIFVALVNMMTMKINF